MSFAAELQKRMEETAKELERARELLKKAKQRESVLSEQMDAIQVLLLGEKRKQQASESVAQFPPTTAPEKSLEAPTVNKAEIIRSIVDMSPNGVTPAQIRKELESGGVPTSPNYVYAALLRAKRAGKIREHGGKYFRMEKTAAS